MYKTHTGWSLVAGIVWWCLLWPCACTWQYGPAKEQSWFQQTVPDSDIYLSPLQQSAVQPPGLLTILMPIEPSPQALGLLRNQLRTFVRFLNISSIAEILVVTPIEHKAEMQAFFRSEMQQQAPNHHQIFRVIDDGECIPEANPAFQWFRDPSAYWWNGWLTQQLLKLACAPLIKTPFYLLLDADVFAARPFDAADLFEVQPCTDDSATCDSQHKLQFRAKNDCHQSYDGKNSQNLDW